MARYRSLPGSAAGQALPPGYPGQRYARQSGRCQREGRLAYPLRICPSADPYRTPSVCEPAARARLGQHRLRAGLHDHRLVSVPVAPDAARRDQGRSQTTYACSAGGALSRRSCSSRTGSCTTSAYSMCGCPDRGLLRDGSRLPRPRTAVLSANSKPTLLTGPHANGSNKQSGFVQ